MPALPPVGTDTPSSSKPETLDLSNISPEYHDGSEVLSKQHALSLPPHHPYYCGINLLPGAPLHTSPLYNLSCPERESMEKYIKESLAEGIIHLASSTAGSFFCVKEGSHTPSLY